MAGLAGKIGDGSCTGVRRFALRGGAARARAFPDELRITMAGAFSPFPVVVGVFARPAVPNVFRVISSMRRAEDCFWTAALELYHAAYPDVSPAC
jgi:hypothetical protein